MDAIDAMVHQVRVGLPGRRGRGMPEPALFPADGRKRRRLPRAKSYQRGWLLRSYRHALQRGKPDAMLEQLLSDMVIRWGFAWVAKHGPQILRAFERERRRHEGQADLFLAKSA
jgi:hypothetical protein